MKELPLGEHEEAGNNAIVMSQILSKRFPIKSMSMGVVACSLPH